ncbi:hypothetical protein P7C71_g4741, partial [Lecanoromycetidae sp. Uapishka_2]
MAGSTSSQHRAQLFRDLSKDSNRTRNSSESSRHSQPTESSPPSVSDFNPEKDEALESTRTMADQAQHLPELRASAQKYNMFAKIQRKDEDREQDYDINTSAVARAFPDFSQGSSAFDDGLEPDSPSIEIGRGAKMANGAIIGKPGRSREYSFNAQLDTNEDSFNSDKPFDIGDGYQVMYTPPIRSRKTSNKTEGTPRDSLKGDVQPRKGSSLRKQIVDPSPPAAKTADYGSGESRNASGENQRFRVPLQSRVRNEDDLSHVSEDRVPAVDPTARNTRFGNTRTQRNRSHDALPSRFSSAQTLMNSIAPKQQQMTQTISSTNPTVQQSFALPSMPKMNELLSGVFDNGTPVFSRHGQPSRFVQNLQQRKDSHRHPNIDEIAMRTDEQAIYLQLQMLQDKCAQLEKKDVETSNIIHELKEKKRTLEDEKNARYQASRRDSGLGTSDSEGAQVAKDGQRRLLAEKNLAQLSVAWCTIEEVKAENEDLRADNDDMKARISQTEAIMRRQSATLEKNHASTSHFDSKPKAKPIYTQQKGQPTHKDANTMFDLSAKQYVTHDIDRDRQQHMQTDEAQQTKGSVHDTHKKEGEGRSQAKPSHAAKPIDTGDTQENLTYLSFIDTQEIAKLRKTLEREHIERKQHEALRQQTSKENETVTRTGLTGAQPQQPRKTLSTRSSMRDVAIEPSCRDINEHSIHSTKSKAEHNRRHSDTSILSTRSRRRMQDPENMTSAFILPDITIRNVPQITKEAQEVLEGLANHKGQNCTVCQREFTLGEEHDHTKKTVRIPKPVPVTDRVRAANEHEADLTIRPSQPPGLALATVLKGLEDELDHLKIKVMKLEANYHSHDKAVDRRKRKAILARIHSHQQEIEVKSDQIYSLYDVLEGQKEANQEMSDEDAEMTMESIGLDPAELHLRGGADRLPWDLESTGSSDGLPWEGIESTS